MEGEIGDVATLLPSLLLNNEAARLPCFSVHEENMWRLEARSARIADQKDVRAFDRQQADQLASLLSREALSRFSRIFLLSEEKVFRTVTWSVA